MLAIQRLKLENCTNKKVKLLNVCYVQERFFTQSLPEHQQTRCSKLVKFRMFQPVNSLTFRQLPALEIDFSIK